MSTEVVTNLRVDPWGLGTGVDRLDLYWDYVRADTVLSYEVWVERSASISGPYSVIAKTYNARNFADLGVHQHPGLCFFYRLRVVRRSDGAAVQTTPTAVFEAEPDLVTLEIRRRTNLLLREYTGVPVLYYPVRSTGLRCPDCWSDTQKHRVKSRCTTCYDTGFVTGFYTPMLMHLNIHEDQTMLSQNAETDETVARNATMLVSGNFPLQFSDLVVERTNQRWLVSAWERTEKLRATLSNHVRLHFLPESDIRHGVPLPRPGIFDEAYRNREYTRQYTLNP